MQVVLVFSQPSSLTTDNLAIALNIECTNCETLASAYQWILGTDGIVHFSPEGNRAIAEIRQALHDLIRSDLPLDELQAELDQLADQLELVLAQELVAAGPPEATFEQVPAGDGLQGLESGSPEPGGSAPAPESTPTPSSGQSEVSPSPSQSGSSPEASTGTVEPSPSPSPTVWESPTPSPTPTPTP